MLRRKSCWLPVAALLCLLTAVPALGADGGKTRDVRIPGTGLVLRVAQGVAVWPEKPAQLDGATLYVAVETIQSFPRNGVVVRADVIAQRAALAKGQAEVAENWEETGLSEVVSLPTGGYAVIYPLYRPFEFCALEFTMNAAFFVGNRRVTIRYSTSPAVITRENPTYFSHDVAENDCDTDTIWKYPDEDDLVLQHFHEAVKAGRLGPAANAWYADFTAIMASLRKNPAN
ncbi:MAG: hypothetical protein WCO53_10990 [Deltaproteobacteria bacterium]